MKRRTVLQMAGLASSLIGCGGGSTPSPTSGDGGGTRPNVLMIALDDLNDWVGYIGGHPQVQTPGIDALAAQSFAFKLAFSNATECSPSRASVLSGLAVENTHVYDNDHTFKSVNPGKDQFEDMLRKGGYTVARYGKIDHSYQSSPLPMPPSQPVANKTCPAPLGEGAFDWWPSTAPDDQHPDWHYTQSGIDFLNSYNGTGPFCLSVGLVHTHVAWYVPKRFFDMYPKEGLQLPSPPADDLDDLGPTGRSIALQYNFHQCITGQGLWADAVQAYLASISWADSQIARLLAALEASPHANNTIVVLWSDHGFHLGEKFHWHKLALWDPGVHVPFIIRLPGQTTAQGHLMNQVVGLRDLAPTLLDYCGVSPSYAMDGQSLRALLEQPDQSWDYPVLTTRFQYDHAVRTAQWRYIRYQSGERELYDMQADPIEHYNLASQSGYAQVMAQLDAYMPPLQGS